jgi:hypothetical protein
MGGTPYALKKLPNLTEEEKEEVESELVLMDYIKDDPMILRAYGLVHDRDHSLMPQGASQPLAG